MRKMMRGGVPLAMTAAALFWLPAAGTMAREPDVSGMRAYPLPGYTIVTHDEESARKLVPAVDALRQVMTTVLEKPARESTLPTHVFVVPLNVWRRYLQPADGVYGEYFAARFRNCILISNSGDQNQVRETALHEFAHHFLRSQREGGIPTWYDEGIATVMSLIEFRSSVVVVGRPPALREIPWYPLNDLLSLDASVSNYWSLKYSDRVLLESWAMVHRGIIGNEEFGRQTQGYLRDINDGQSIDAAVAKNFGMRVAELNPKIHAYLETPARTIRSIPFNRMPIPDSLESREMPELEVLQLLANVMLDASLKPERIDDVIAAIEKRAPGSATPLVLRLRVATRNTRNPPRLESAWMAVVPAARDVQVGRDAALAVFDYIMPAKAPDPGRARDYQQMRETAFTWLGASLDANPQDPEAAWAYGILAAQMKRDLDAALRHVQQARELVPEHPDLALAAALLHDARGESNSKLLRLQDVARFTRSTEQRSWARSFLK